MRKVERSAGAIVYRETTDGIEYLVIRIKGNQDWGFPKGDIESGESEIEAAIREIFEEVGLRLNIENSFRSELEYKLKSGVDKEVVYFIVKSNNQQVVVDGNEIDLFKWCNLEDGLKLLTYQSTKDLLIKGDRYLRGG